MSSILMKMVSFLSCREGFAPLAARPGEQLSIVQFANEQTFFQDSKGKPFCSRKTPPTLKSSSKRLNPTKKHTRLGVLFCGAEKRI